MPDVTSGTPPPPGVRMAQLLEEIAVADRAGVDLFGVGEHHRAEFVDASPAVILAAAARATNHSHVCAEPRGDLIRAERLYAYAAELL
ncbi:hypothetical protein [Tardiphaga robiniae]